jgi:hypothetical protein
MSSLVDSRMLSNFITEIKNVFPSMVAGVIADKHGFLMHSEWNQMKTRKLDEELLALSAVSNRRLLDLSNYQKVVRPLGMNAKLLVLLEKTNVNLHKFKQFNQVVKDKNPI